MKNKIQEFVGKKGWIELGGLEVGVEVKDVKNTYGRDRYLVSPISGQGEVWVEKVNIETK